MLYVCMFFLPWLGFFVLEKYLLAYVLISGRRLLVYTNIKLCHCTKFVSLPNFNKSPIKNNSKKSPVNCHDQKPGSTETFYVAKGSSV